MSKSSFLQFFILVVVVVVVVVVCSLNKRNSKTVRGTYKAETLHNNRVP